MLVLRAVGRPQQGHRGEVQTVDDGDAGGDGDTCSSGSSTSGPPWRSASLGRYGRRRRGKPINKWRRERPASLIDGATRAIDSIPGHRSDDAASATASASAAATAAVRGLASSSYGPIKMAISPESHQSGYQYYSLLHIYSVSLSNSRTVESDYLQDKT